MNAKTWNESMATELGMASVSELRTSISTKEMLVRSEDRLSANIIKHKYLRDKKLTPKNSNNSEIESTISKYTLRLRDDSSTIEDGITCSGKLIVGIDFSNSDLSNSYFNDCTFYNCDFTDSNMETVVFNGCIINSCVMSGSNLTASFFIKSSIMDTVLDRSILDGSVITDCMVIGCQGMYARFVEARFTGCGIADSLFTQSNFIGSAFVLTSFSLTELCDSSFIECGWFDVIFVDVDLRGIAFDKVFATCVSGIRVNTDDSSLKDIFNDDSQIKKELVSDERLDDGPDFDGGLEDTHA